jgi:hypothetical protein
MPRLHPEPADGAAQRACADDADTQGLGGPPLPRDEGLEGSECGEDTEGGTTGQRLDGDPP